MSTYLKAVRYFILLLCLITVNITVNAQNACSGAITLTSGVSCSTTSGDLQDATKDGPNSGSGCYH